MAVKTAIAILEESKSVPTVSLWYRKIWDLYITEKITDSINQSEPSLTYTRYDAKWLSVLEYMAKQHFLSKDWVGNTE